MSDPDPLIENTVLRGRIASLLHNLAKETPCRGCGMMIYFVTHKNGKTAPYQADGQNHFINCPKAEQFRR